MNKTNENPGPGPDPICFGGVVASPGGEAFM